MKKTIRKAFFALTLICYLSVLFSPDIFWVFGFIGLMIPLILAIHFILLIINIPRIRKAFFFHLAALLVGLAFIRASYSISSNDKNGKIKVLSYNVRVFNNYSNLRNENYKSSKKMIGWALDNEAQIKCFQEYYNNDKSDIFNVRTQMEKSGWKYHHEKIMLQDKSKAEFGIIIYSKYPIVNKGEISNDEGTFLNSIYADIKIHNDTIRVYNTHLESMAINEENVVSTERLARSYVDTGYRLKNGFISRARQVKALTSDIRSSPYKTILCGDLNEVPYSYAYFSLRNLLHNAFEKAGNGFGFTYNGKLFFLRIDNQFYSPDISIHSFHTHRNADFSDHFPLTATYSW